MPSTFEYNNDVRKVNLTCASTLDLRSGLFDRFKQALDGIHTVSPINSIMLEAVAGGFDLTVLTVAGQSLTCHLTVSSGGEVNFTITSGGTMWRPTQFAASMTMRSVVSEMLVVQGMTALEIDYF